MPNKMLIDASHQEETRVVVVRGSRIEEFDFESQDKKQLKGNIYLARVTRVEPSLQAAFVEYGGNRHGFLAFSEIHPDYYQIPVADRQALLRAEAEEASEEDDDAEEAKPERERARAGNGRRRRRGRDRGRDSDVSVAETNMQGVEPTPEESGLEASSDESLSEAADAGGGEAEGSGHDAGDASSDETASAQTGGGEAKTAAIEADVVSEPAPEVSEDRGTVEDVASGSEEHDVESVGAEDALEEAQTRRRPVRRHYKIQEVIKRRQILLVQVVKEERGNKGAALTTYLSLAGRYSVLMPNTARGGGISRKITNVQDRKRLKEVMADLEVPQGMGVILRTAGESRTKAEIKRDYEYLMRMWDNVRNLTLQSTAPALVYEEGSLIKRSVRDLYNKDIDEILVSGEDGYREAKDFMRMLMPSHAKVVQPYRETTPIFVRSGIEAQLDRMLQPQVTLKSGGYLIINQTEALVSIDVNSGRSTREHSIEETALHTNLEAAEEVARQLRLRDLAGLIVIDFIDMEENRNNRAVEKKLKDCLKNDRARIQVGRISHFGLLEMSRQRIRASVLESTMKPCPHCGGTGHVRSDSSVALAVVRAIEEFLLKDSKHHITVRTPTSTALYVLNHKRATLSELERRFQLTVTIEADESVGNQHYVITRGAVIERPEGFIEPSSIVPVAVPEEEDEDEEIVAEEETDGEDKAESEADSASQADGEGGDRRKRRRRRRRGGRDRGDHLEAQPAEHAADAAEGDAVAEDVPADAAVSEPAPGLAEAMTEDAAAEPAEDAGKKRRRGKRGGKKNRTEDEASAPAEATGSQEAVTAEAAPPAEPETVPVAEAAAPAPEPLAEPETVAAEPPAKPKRARRTTRTKKAEEAAIAEEPAQPAAEAAMEAAPAEETREEIVVEPAEAKPAAPARPSRRRASASPAPAEPVVSSAAPSTEPEGEQKPKKVGWWQKRSFF